MRIDAYQVKCKCGTFRCDGWNEWLAAASSLSYTVRTETRIEKEHFRGQTFERAVTRNINADFRCDACRRYYKVEQINGVVKPDHKCPSTWRAA